MRLAVSLGGTDSGKSGIGVYVDRVLPRLRGLVEGDGGSLVVLGTELDHKAYASHLHDVPFVRLPDGGAGPSAMAHWASVSVAARVQRADALLLPAANRRTSAASIVPTVSVVHDLAQLHIDDKYDRARMFYFRRVMLPSLRRATRLVAVSDATRRDLREALGASMPPVDVVWNGVEAAQFSPESRDESEIAQVRRRTDLREDYLLYAARLEHPGKNHVRLLEAFRASGLHERYVLALAGKDWGAEKQLRRVAREVGIESRVRFLGFVSDHALTCLVQAASLVLMAGLHEGFGLPALEACAAGVPTCASNTGALPEVVGEYGVLFDPLQVSSIARSLQQAVVDERLRDRVRREGPARAAQHTWDHTARGLLAACVSAVGASS